MSDDIQYPEHFIDRLEIVWGAGFLSPGGIREVKEIVRGLDLAGQTVLDIGCGVGGPAVALARDLGAARVIGIDVEAELLARAARHVERAGVADRVALRQVSPGPLPFADATFDLVFSKDSLIHVADKAALYREILRVLRPGGVLAASDWLAGEHADQMPEFARFIELAHLSFAMATAAETAAVMRSAGFDEVTTRDRNAWYARLATEEADQVEGPLRDRLIDAAGAEVYADWVKVRRALADAAVAGGLRPTHLRGLRPPAS